MIKETRKGKGENEMTETLIKTEAHYNKYLEEIEKLIDEDPPPGSDKGERLSLLALAIQDYEANRYFFEKPTSTEAIRFRMDEQGLNQNDLVPFIGSKSKVSEILSGKRKLTLPMIRALNKHLGIPLPILVQESAEPSSTFIIPEIEWSKFPVSEMIKRNWLKGTSQEITAKLKILIGEFLNPLEGTKPQTVMWKRSFHNRTGNGTDTYSLLAWIARILFLAKLIKANPYDGSAISKDFLREVAKLSQFQQGPLLAREMLQKYGIKLVIEKHLQKTKLDGGCFIELNGNPVIGMTLRFDRLDNFWHTLLHELAHIHKHLREKEEVYLDDLEYDPKTDLKEKEADKLAREAFIPRSIWKRSSAFIHQTEKGILELAKQLNIHPAIVAGRIRYESGNYSKFSNFVGSGEVRKLFGVE